MGIVSHGFGRFRDLTDVPSSYTGQAGQVVKVNATETGLEFGIGGGGSAITVFNEGSTLTTNLASLDFVGANVEATAIGDAVTVTVTGGSVNAGDLFLLMGG